MNELEMLIHCRAEQAENVQSTGDPGEIQSWTQLSKVMLGDAKNS